MYSLTLSADERRAIDWIGNRYSNGDDLYRLLWVQGTQSPNDVDWDYDGDMVFTIPEHVAWQIRDNAEQEDGFWPCFADELASKLQAFCDAIV